MNDGKTPEEIQRLMYNFIVDYMKSEGMPPTNREIGRKLNIASTGHVDFHLMILEKKGLISRQAQKSRGIKLIQNTAHGGLPLIGAIAAGEPLDIYFNSTKSVDINHSSVETDDTYALAVRGNSMIEDHICDGDYIIIKPQPSYQNGDIVVAVHTLKESDQIATLKRFFQEPEQDRVRLQPANSNLSSILISKKVWDREWQIHGKVISVFRSTILSDRLETQPTLENTEHTYIYSNETIQEGYSYIKRWMSSQLFCEDVPVTALVDWDLAMV